MRLLGIISAFITVIFVGLGFLSLTVLPDEAVVDTRVVGVALLVAGFGWQMIYLYCMDRKRDVEAEAMRYYQTQRQETDAIPAE